MAISITHPFVSAKSDGPDDTLVQPGDWNAAHTITMATSRLIGRTTALDGAAEEISVGTGLTLSGGSLTLDSDLQSWAGVTRASGFDTWAATPSSANLASLVTGETGSGALMFGTSPSVTTDIRPASHDGASLGTAALGFSDVFLGTGGVVTFGDASTPNVTITHLTDTLTFNLKVGQFVSQDAFFPQYRIINYSNSSNAGYLLLRKYQGTTASPANVSNGDTIGTILFDAFHTAIGEAASISAAVDGTPGNGDMPGRLMFATSADGTASPVERMRITSAGNVQPGSNDGGSLGVAGTAWSDLFLATGGVVNWGNGDVTLTHSTGVLTMSDDSFVVGAPTGGAKGNGTINAVAVYDDNVLLTDYVFDHWQTGALDPTDANNERAQAFDPSLLDIDIFSASCAKRRALPSMLRRSEWSEDTRFSLGELAQRLWETVEIQAVHIAKLNERLKELEARLAQADAIS